jgi:AraC-like DNA-binding protein
MNGQLTRITDMPDRAAASGWCINELAKSCGVSVPTFERFFHEEKRQCPRDWILEERMRRARTALMDGYNVQETTGRVGYKNQHHFSLVFKKFHSYCPKEHKARMEALKKIEDGKLKIGQNGNPRSKVRSLKPKVRRTQDAGRRTQDAGRRTQDATMMPCGKWRFDDFKYIYDEFRYTSILACN